MRRRTLHAWRVGQGDRMESLLDLLDRTAVRVILALGLAWGAAFAVGRLSRPLVRVFVARPGRRVDARDVSEAQLEARFARRVATLQRFIARAFATAAIVTAAVYTLYLLDVRLYGVLAGAGIVGIAVAFGAQTIVRDALSGIFLLIENPYDIGDFVRVNAIEGEVVAISLRRTTLLGDDGSEHTVPNGAIVQTTNFSRAAVRHVLVLRVASETPYELVVDVVERVAQLLVTAPDVGDQLVEGPSVRGIVAFRSESYDVEVRSRIQRSLRRRWPLVLNRQLMQACAEADIRVL